MEASAWPEQHYVILETKWGVREPCQLSPQVSVDGEVRQPGSYSATKSSVNTSETQHPEGPGDRLVQITMWLVGDLA